MINWVLRGAVLLWAVFFLILGVQGVLDPATYTGQFGIAADGVAANTVRADMSAFFLVSAVAAAIGALLPRWRGALLVPAALYGTALVGRLIGAASGDMVGPAIIQAMIVEALSLALMAGSWWVLSRPTVVAAGQAGDEASPV
ncbi:hypothetical protein [Sphingopyxis panaciterrulae]|uniref:DUF4345 domain-containing protein n=1 Tax=Sphingopyxis panaciterrulae TaxID=462372 RepID=A0A7W9EQK0_9SPHN|nr:hypothetical protein [Sphingopyxis panaciterrulae]MBB5706574.1 hypothetical protein [Sphingopyxis panaciterrulae]